MANNTKPSKWLLKLGLHRLCHPKNPSPSSRRRNTDFREAFRRFDADGDGKISGNELRSFLSSWSGDDVSPRAAAAAMQDFDSDGDGLIDYDDFLKLVGGGEEDIKRAFEMFEAGAGCITADGLRRMLGRLGDVKTAEECAAMIRAYDLDGDGVLDYSEFLRMMN